MEKLNEFEKRLLTLMKRGLYISEISEKLRDEGIKPNSIPSIDKKLKEWRDKYKCKTMFQLAYKLKRRKLI